METFVPSHGAKQQSDQNVPLLKVLGNKFSYKSGPNICKTFWAF